MAKQITDQPTLAAADPGDLLLTRDISVGVDKKVTVAGLASAVGAAIPNGSLTYAQTDGKTWFEEIGRGVVAANSVTVTFPARKYLQLRISTVSTSGYLMNLRFNGDSGNNYAYRATNDLGAIGTATSTNAVALSANGNTSVAGGLTVDIDNPSGREKSIMSTQVHSVAGAANLPTVRFVWAKWTNSGQMTSVTLYNGASGSLDGTEVAVLGKN